jgi:4-amino-4-deoxy-L-arabinose transferase-like glycosyltransferase
MTGRLTLVILLAFALRIYHAARLWLWGDEAWGLYLIRQGFWQLTLETALDHHPPLYHQLTYLWSLFAGRSELALRLFSIFAGVLAVPLAYQVGKRLSGRVVGALGALLVAIAPFSVHYSQEARMYSLATALGLASSYVLLGLIRRPERRAWATYGLITLLGLLTVYSYAFFVAFQGMALLLLRRARARFPAWLAVQGILAVVLIPFMLFFIRPILAGLSSQSTFSEVKSLPALLAEAWRGFAVGVTLDAETAGPLALGIGVITIAALVGARFIVPFTALKNRRPTHDGLTIGEQLAYLTGALAIPLLLLYPLHVRLPWFQPRVFAFLAPALYLLLAWGLAALWRWRRAGGVLGTALVAFAWAWALRDYYVNFSRYDAYEDYRPLIAHFEAHTQPGDLVLHHARWQEGYFEAYYDGPPLNLEYIQDTRGRYAPAFDGLNPVLQPVALTKDQVGALISPPRQVWIMLRDIVRHPGGPLLEDQVEDWVSDAGFKVDEAWFGHVRVARYALPQPIASDNRPVGAVFENGIRLQGYDLIPAAPEIQPGATLYLTLYWQADGPTTATYTAFTHIVGTALNPKDGTPVWAGHDMPPGNGERPTTSWSPGETVRDPHALTLDPNAPSGEYILEAGLYDAASGHRLRARGADGANDDHVILMTLTVR